jgi:lysophospholipase L1-like esterase
VSTEPPTGKRAGCAATAALLLTTLVLSVLVVEFVLRVYASTASTALAEALRRDPYAVLVEPHGTVGYRPRPGRVVRYENGTQATVNAMGFRGPEVARKPAGTFRVVLLGGSTTFGWGVDDDGTVDAWMRRILAKRIPERDVEVVNLGFDGYDSYQLLERLRSDGLELEPDALIVHSGVNDVRNAWFEDIVDGDTRTLLYEATLEQLRFEKARGAPTAWTRTKHFLYVARVPGWVSGQLVEDPWELSTVEYAWSALDYFERNLVRIVEEAAGDGASVLLSTPPSSLETKYEPDAEPIRSYWLVDAKSTQTYRDSLDHRMRSVVENLSRSGRPVVYVPHEALAPDLFLDDAHLTSAGNRRVAEEFVTALEPWIER